MWRGEGRATKHLIAVELYRCSPQRMEDYYENIIRIRVTVENNRRTSIRRPKTVTWRLMLWCVHDYDHDRDENDIVCIYSACETQNHTRSANYSIVSKMGFAKSAGGVEDSTDSFPAPNAERESHAATRCLQHQSSTLQLSTSQRTSPTSKTRNEERTPPTTSSCVRQQEW